MIECRHKQKRKGGIAAKAKNMGIVYEDKPRYFDKNGKEIFAGDTIKYPDGTKEKVYMTSRGELGTDATNPLWIERGDAAPCEYGIYPLSEKELAEVEVCDGDYRHKQKEGSKMDSVYSEILMRIEIKKSEWKQRNDHFQQSCKMSGTENGMEIGFDTFETGAISELTAMQKLRTEIRELESVARILEDQINK